MATKRILGVQVTDRTHKAETVQHILTQYGCNIKTRIGLHDVDASFCDPNGIMLLELFGDEALCDELKAKLEGTGGVTVQEMIFPG